MAGDFDSISNRLITQSGFTQKALSKSFERLSSGLRINSASDDAAALSLADKLETRGANLAVAYRNANDSISLLNVASSAVDELGLIVTRLQELATRTSTGGLSGSQRVAANKEAAALTDEYNRVASSTKYNNQGLFGSTAYSGSVQVGDTGAQNSSIAFELASDSTITAGNGTFAAATTIATGISPYALDLIDLNGDGVLDIIDAPLGVTTVNIRLGNGNGTFGTAISVATATGAGARSFVTDDFNNDGKLDLVFAGDGTGVMTIALGNGNGTFSAATTVATGIGLVNLEVLGLDINSDGNRDLVTYSPSGFLNFFIGSGSGTFALSQSVALAASLGRPDSVGDIDGDGDDDVIIGSTSGLFVYSNNGGTFGAATTILSGNVTLPRLGDFDSDGDLDIATAIPTGDLRVSLNNGSGSFTTFATIAGTGLGFNHTALADVNGDQILDVVGTSATAGGGFVVFLGTGDGSFQSAISQTVAYAGSQLALGDINGDGAVDIVGTSINDNLLTVARGVATTTNYQQRIRTIRDVDLSSIPTAREAITYLSKVATDISAVQGTINSHESRISFAGELASRISELSNQSAETIRSVDTASEVANLVSNQVRAAGQSALLAQAGSLQVSRVTKLFASL